MLFRLHRVAALIAVAIVCTGPARSQAQLRDHQLHTSLSRGFESPPESAKPRVWWHWMNGNVSRQGIRLDLDWMHRIGLGGMDTIDASLGTPQYVKQRAVYMTPEWKSDFLYATRLAEQFHMRESIDSSPGWSETGGPWVKPSQGMKKYVWSEVVIPGDRHFNGKLPHPPTATGAFQDEDIHEVHRSPMASHRIPTYYADSVVLAYRLPADDVSLASLHPMMSSSGGSPDYALLTDGNLVKTTSIPIPAAGKTSWIEYTFPHPVTMRAITLVMHPLARFTSMFYGIGAPRKTLEASDDGITWRSVAKLDTADSPETTISFLPVTARYFRVAFQRGATPPLPERFPGKKAVELRKRLGPGPSGYRIAELVLHPGARVNRFEEKAAFVPAVDLYRYATPDYGRESVVKVADVINLTSKMRPDGTLDWTPPPGRWAALRFGYSLLGITNHPAPVEATGLEVDKLNGQDVRQYMKTYLDSYKSAVGASNMGAHGITSVTNDSWEAGSQNWTDDMIQQFRKLRGYNPIPWMPVLAGVVVGSPAESDRFLWDFRETIGDLIASQHFGVIQKVLDQWHLNHYCESDEHGRSFVADGMQVKEKCQVPMGAMWTPPPGSGQIQYDYNADDRESASVAHIYGQNLAAAESMTTGKAPWSWSPDTLKPTADQEFLNGINRIFIHESTEQPLLNKKPGLTLGAYGQWFNRNETWASEAGPWIDYLGRNSYMLQQGRFAADILYYYGQDTNLTALYENRSPNLPDGYDFDYANADTVTHVLGVDGAGNITTPGGVTYRILGLNQNSRYMSLPVLEAIHRLVMDGASVAGPKPTADPSLADNQSEFRSLSNEMFGGGYGIHRIGKGTVYAGQTVAEALAEMHVEKDFSYVSTRPDANLKFIHRKLVHGDIYFVDNRSDSPVTAEASFRVTGMVPKLWRSDTGRITSVSYRIANGRTVLPLDLGPWGSVFVVFHGHATEMSWTAPEKVKRHLATIHGPWKVSFPPHWGAPATITLSHLASWSDNSNRGVRYFSGTGTYTKTIHAPAAWFVHGGHIWMNLGVVKNLANVTVNGRPLGIVWHTPYRLDVSSALHPGSNTLTIRVTNAWVNRLIGDEQPDATKKYTFTDFHPYTARSPLLPSGLLGPVTLDAVTTKQQRGSNL
ncbi:MAG: glycosyl hydrolase [Acidobacteriaceae bacterium]